jgi:hypothetical protein
MIAAPRPMDTYEKGIRRISGSQICYMILAMTH